MGKSSQVGAGNEESVGGAGGGAAEWRRDLARGCFNIIA